MKYQRFEDLPVWQAAIRLGCDVYSLTEDPAFKSRYSLRKDLSEGRIKNC